MSVCLTLRCDGYRNGTHCRSERITGLAYSPQLRSDDHNRCAGIVDAARDDGWRIGAATHGGDLCPKPDHDEDQPDPLKHAQRTLTARAANEGLT
jgi:hypothetical protein